MITVLALSALLSLQDVSVNVVERAPVGGRNDYYLGNRDPLVPTPFRKLPVGTIKSLGWVRKQLQLEADGFIGHLTEISPWLKKENNAWLSPTGEGEHGWEEVPYWLKGFGDLGYVLGDKRVTDEAKFWIDHILKGQAENGWIGPRSNLIANKGTPDMWPNMPVLNALQSYYEYTGDKRVIDAMSRYFKWQLDLPEEQFYLSYWEKHRGGDNMASVFWLYNITGDASLLKLAEKIHRRGADWAAGVANWHGVNFAQAFREPAEFAVLQKDQKLVKATERNYMAMHNTFGQVPGGMYGADEDARRGFTDPRQAAETCAMVEMMYSNEMLLAQTGDPVWAERCEDVTFNSLPASMTADEKALHYLTSPNMVLIDKESKSPGLENGGPMLLFNPYDHRCCQHNVSHGWPYYAENLWYATGGSGLAALLYAPSEVTAKVDNGQTFTIREETNYPFEETIRFKFSADSPARFPLTLRLPSWCANPTLSLNGKRLTLPNKGNYAILESEWKDGDVLQLNLPMQVKLVKWPENKDAVSVQRGPLSYSLKIGEKYVREGGTNTWPAFEVHPTTPWNYGLTLERFEVKMKPWPKDDQPFTTEAAPIQISTKARRIPEWSTDYLGLVGVLQPSPARSNAPVERVTLIPMGAAKLRVSSFPTVSPSGGTVWKASPKPKPGIPSRASHVWAGDNVKALSDGFLPTSSADETIPRMTWWDHKGTEEWVEYDFGKPMTFTQARVYWFDDTKNGGGCKVPASWKLLFWTGSQWSEVPSPSGYETLLDIFCNVRFAKAKASKWRIAAQLQPQFSGGILEWELK